jgi:dTDP-4-dehydrorhamnose reductase
MAADTILVTGSNGQLGSELKQLVASFPQYHFKFFNREEFPITDKTVAAAIFRENQPAFLVNCAAYTAVDKAESEKELATAINGEAVGYLAALSHQFNTRFIHVSTDYVFNGQATRPLKEADATDPVNAYGASKLKGEELAQELNPGALIIRTSWVYSYFGKNFVRTMMRLMKEKESIGVVHDQVGSPTYAADLAEVIMTIISSGKWHGGIYHYSNDGVISWYDFAQAIREMTGSSCTVNPITTQQFPTPAKRPAYSVMDTSKIKSTFGIKGKDWKESLRRCVELILKD